MLADGLDRFFRQAAFLGLLGHVFCSRLYFGFAERFRRQQEGMMARLEELNQRTTTF